MVHGQIGVGQGLRLHALGGVHHQQRALAGGQRPADLVVEVHMARRVDQVQGVSLPVIGGIENTHGTGFNGDAALAFQVHIVQQLVLHLALRNGVALLQQPVRQRGFTVVNVGDDGEIADMRLVKHTENLLTSLPVRPRCG